MRKLSSQFTSIEMSIQAIVFVSQERGKKKRRIAVLVSCGLDSSILFCLRFVCANHRQKFFLTHRQLALIRWRIRYKDAATKQMHAYHGKDALSVCCFLL